MDYLTLLSVLDGTVRTAAPLVLAALAGLFAERSGVVDIGLEGKMLAGAFAAAAAASVTGSPWLGLFAAIGAGILLSMVHAYATVTHHGNQVVSGMAINILVAGLTPPSPSPGSSRAARRRSSSRGTVRIHRPAPGRHAGRCRPGAGSPLPGGDQRA